jgi:hypothetical protein
MVTQTAITSDEVQKALAKTISRAVAKGVFFGVMTLIIAAALFAFLVLPALK